MASKVFHAVEAEEEGRAKDVDDGGGFPEASRLATRVSDGLTALRDAYEPTTVLLFDVGLCLGLWLCAGVLIFHSFVHSGHFTWTYAFYFSVNVGLGVGSAPYRPSHFGTRLFTCAFVVTGNFLIVGGLGAYFQASADRLRRAFALARDESELFASVGSRTRLLAGGYVAVVCVGALVARDCAEYDAFVDQVLWSVTNLTTSGLLVGKRWNRNWKATAAFLLCGVPYAMMFFGELASQSFVYRERLRASRRRSSAAEAARRSAATRLQSRGAVLATSSRDRRLATPSATVRARASATGAAALGNLTRAAAAASTRRARALTGFSRPPAFRALRAPKKSSSMSSSSMSSSLSCPSGTGPRARPRVLSRTAAS